MEKFKPNCNEWLGYKPCVKQKEHLTNNCENCLYYSPILGNSLIMEAGGLGGVLRTSVVAKEIKKANPDWQIQWLTHEKGVELIDNIPSVDNAIVHTEENNLLILQAQEYDKIINFESSPLFLALARKLRSKEKLGFAMNDYGKLDILSNNTEEFLRLQTDDYFRQRINTKSMQQILLEVAGFSWDEQLYELTTKKHDDERATQFLYEHNLLKDDHPKIVGLNIGSSEKNKAKRWPIQNFYELAKQFKMENPDWKFVVLADPEDQDIYEELKNIQANAPLENMVFSGNNNSISQFISLVNKIPIVVSADTFGMHTAIALQKNVISLHGPQPEQEIYLYNQGQKIHLNLECAPCFAPKIERCMNTQRLQCMRELNVNLVQEALKNEVKDH